MLRLVAVGLCVAAVAAIVAILSGDFSDGDLKVIGTSLLFALTAATGGASQALRLRGGEGAVLGTIVLGASLAAFVLVSLGIWLEPDSDEFWKITGAIGIVAVDGAHACLVLGWRRQGDPAGAESATAAAVGAAAVSATFGVAAVAGVADGPWELLAVVLIAQLLFTTLAPLLRRLGRDASPTAPAPFGELAVPGVAEELRAIADELDAAGTTGAIRDQTARLRAIAARPDVR